ncbi:MAG: hypothetical protein A3G87_07220 [Omnitrophica bacterium RIFCSPLOWO2_12_FULL_50_11]|nr:MAG: hypothetical protein A3G87_07220 [Omnitrophica bacterium RIFCSPLOWO2_12_FULL_50_11]
MKLKVVGDDQRQRKMCMNKQFFFFVIVFSFCFTLPTTGSAQEETNLERGEFLVLEGKIMDIEELDEPDGKLILNVRDVLSEKVLRLSADSHRATVQGGDRMQSVRDLVSGSMATIIYRKSAEEELPELVYIKTASSYDS